jgi:hypothetical protein
LDARLGFVDLGDKSFHFQDMLRAELHADVAAFAIFLDDFDSG